MHTMIRLTDKFNFTDKRVEPGGIWKNFTHIFKSAFGELSGHDALQALYVNNRMTKTEEYFILSHLLGISIEEMKDIYETKQSSGLSIKIHKNPVLIIGREGTGKSTYLKYHLGYVATHLLSLKILPVFIDFKAGPPQKEGILNFSIQQTRQQFLSFLNKYHQTENILADDKIRDTICASQYDIYKGLFEKLKDNQTEIENIRLKIFENLYADDGAFNRLLADYIQHHLNYVIILVSDNLDHHLDENYIGEVIQASMYEKASYNVNLVICMRDYNYGIAAKNRLRAYDYHTFTLTPPDLYDILVKRVNYASEQIEKEKKFKAEDISEAKEKVLILLEKTESNILRDFAGDNMRLLLASAKRILSSGHLKFFKDPEERKIKLEVYYFLKALMLGNRTVFMPSEYDIDCNVVNLFENGNPTSPGNNLIRLRLLQCMQLEGTFIRRDVLIRYMVLLGYEKEEIEAAIGALAGAEILESSELGHGSRSLRFLVFTEKGRYHLKTLLYELTYIEELRTATYLPEVEFRQILRSKFEDRSDIMQRMAETSQFIDYIKSREEQEYAAIRVSNRAIEALSIYGKIESFKMIAHAYYTQIEAIKRKAGLMS
ncbi:MAG TPA: hypothetical protein VGO58_18840 [Chitinophagaceae bacterium]|jgi:hypothetical protein|nr:hypothetical protein [Chitinophagaceae bacterium]